MVKMLTGFYGNWTSGEEFYLDWDQDKLEAWETKQNTFLVNAMREGIRLGHSFPPVNVFKKSDNLYQLVYSETSDIPGNYGGHHRSVAHYSERAPLKCNLMSTGGLDITNDKKFYSIGDFELTSSLVDKWRIKDSLSFLPVDVAKDFCKEYNLDASWYLAQ